MSIARSRFHEELDALETEIVTMGSLAENAVAAAMEALTTRSLDRAEQVIAGDDEIDERYVGVERRILDLIAMQAPVATDLRLISAMLHINLHLERVGDQAVNIAKIARVTNDNPVDEGVMSQLQEMSDVVRPMLRTAIEAFARRDLDLCLELPKMDDPVDRLNRNMYREVAALASDPSLLEWGIRMNIVARQLERVGDHAVDIGEQVGFLLTGEFREFTDASHPNEHDI